MFDLESVLEKVKIDYSALFVNDVEELKKIFPPIYEKVYYHHSTIVYRPESLDGLEVGKSHKLRITGRAHDMNCDALLVYNEKSNNKHPHITLSVTKDTSPVYSNKMLEEAIKNDSIEYFEEIILIDVTEGYFDGEKVIIK